MSDSAALRIGVHPSSLGGYDGVSRAAGPADAETIRSLCRLCGLPFFGSPLFFFRNGDRRHCDADNRIEACPACVLVQGAGRLTASAEIVPIWLPELSQRGLNRLTSSLHERAQAIGLPVDFSHAPGEDTPKSREMLKVWAGLLERRTLLASQAGIRTVTDVVDICLAHDPVNGTCPPRLRAGLRLLHHGRFYAGGSDIYPDFIRRIRNPPKSTSSTPASGASNSTPTGPEIVVAAAA